MTHLFFLFKERTIVCFIKKKTVISCWFCRWSAHYSSFKLRCLFHGLCPDEDLVSISIKTTRLLWFHEKGIQHHTDFWWRLTLSAIYTMIFWSQGQYSCLRVSRRTQNEDIWTAVSSRNSEIRVSMNDNMNIDSLTFRRKHKQLSCVWQNKKQSQVISVPLRFI